jgi:YgiT-type zinc finger domain-containing protein
MKETDKERGYSDCFFCGGMVEEQIIPREYRWDGQLFIIENVPVGVCTQCGEKFIKPEVAKTIDGMFQEKRKPAKIIQVPVYEYELDVA